MTDQSAPQSPDPQPSNGARPARPRRRWLGYAASAVLGAVIGVVGVGAAAKHHMARGWTDDTRFARMLDHRLDRALDRLDATEAQRDEIKDALTPAALELRGFALETRERRSAMVAALTGAQVDRSALEAIRAERLLALEARSRETMDALADAAEALTTEQRAEIAERFERRLR